MRFRVLGHVAVEAIDPAILGGPKQRAVLAMLLAGRSDPVSIDAIAAGVWGDDLPASVAASVHSYVSHLRTAIGEAIQRVGGGYRIDVRPGDIDAVAFERMLDEARRMLSTDAHRAGETLRVALALWRGRPYADVDDFPGLAHEARRLSELRLVAVEARVDADLAIGRQDVLIGELEALAAQHPLREGFRARHMLALYRAGRQAEALRAYQQTREVLAEELGVDPSPELRQLEERILAHDPSLSTPQDAVTGELAFLITDLEGSTVLWETWPEQMRQALTQHDEVLAKAIEEAGGRIFKHMGDGILAVFPGAPTAARAAMSAQRVLAAEQWVEIEALRVRMGIDVGEVESRGGDFFGPALNRAARLMAAAHGGQVIVSERAYRALAHEAGVQILNLGEHRFKGLGAPQQVYQLILDGLRNEFPALRTDAAAPDAGRTFGDAIRGYELREQIGAGRFGVVYRAYQPSVGREVAVKVIRPEFGNHPEFVRRFEAEARTVAKLEHPHIVSLYDFWRDHEGAYLVMPFLAGRSLAGAPFGAMALDDAMPILSHVGAALSYAHRQGVIHRDLKPANILLDSDGNAYLADFGVAIRAVERASGIQPTSQLYRAPEDRAGEALDARTDIYSLAAVAVEILTGQSPSQAALETLEPEIASVLSAALAVDRTARPASVDHLLAALEPRAGRDGLRVRRAPMVVRNPYKGLAAFDTADARDFYGRDGEIEALVELVAAARLVTVVGPSGSGKSSLVRAGLLPALERDAVLGSSRWLEATMVPGGLPLDELATELAELATEPMGDLVAELRSDPRGLLRLVKRLLRDLDGELLLVVDQFEELYTLVSDANHRDAFVEALVAAVDDPRSRLRVVLTIRADFFDRPLADDRLSDRVSAALLAVGVPGSGALAEIVERPAEAAGVRLDPGLAARLVADVRGEPGALPLLQFVLTDLVDRSVGGLVGLEGYEAVGGVVGAIGQRATEVLAGLSPGRQIVAEQIFLRLVTVSGEADDVRRRVRRSELESLGFDRADVDAVLAAFGGARLLTFDRDPITRSPTVEVAHEALLREWPVFLAWVAERREALLIRRRFELALGEWRDAGDAPDHLPAGGRLAQFEEWAAEAGVSLAADEQAFLTAAVDRRDRDATDRRRRRRMVLNGFTAAAVVALVLAVAAWMQRSEAVQSAALADARGLVLEADRARATDPELGVHLALQAIDDFHTAQAALPPSAVAALRSSLADHRIVARFQADRFVAVHPTDRLVATADGDDVTLVDWADGSVVGGLVRDGGRASEAVFSPDGRLLVVSYQGIDPPVTVWDVDSGEARHLGSRIPQWSNPVLAVSPDGRLVAFHVLDPPGVEVWSTERGEVVYATDDGGWGPDFGDDGRMSHLYCPIEAESCELRISRPASGEALRSIPIDCQCGWTSWSPDQTMIAVSDQSSAHVIDLSTGQTVSSPNIDRAWAPVWVRDGEAYMVGGESVPRIIDARSGRVVAELRGGQAGTWSYELVPGTGLAISATLDVSEALVHDVSDQGKAGLASWPVPLDTVAYAFYASGGSHVVVEDGQGFAVVDTDDGAVSWQEPGNSAATWFPTVNESGMHVASSTASGLWTVRRIDNGQTVYAAPAGWTINAINDDASLVVMASRGDSAEQCMTQLVSTEHSEVIGNLDAGCMLTGTFAPDSSMVVTHQGGNQMPGLRVFDTVTTAMIAEIDDVEFDGITARFSPDGSRLLVGTFAGLLHVLDVGAFTSGASAADAALRTIDAHDALILVISVSPDGSMAVTAPWNEPLRLWDLEAGALLGEFGTPLPDGHYGGDFHPTEPRLVVTSPPNMLNLHTLDIDELVEVARSRLTRDLTDGECLLYLRRACGEA